MPDELAKALRVASLSKDPSMGERAVAIAGHFSSDRALASYASLVQGLLRGRNQPGRAL
jgi:hypothetical protein